jgi:tetratricopeptide (TPR) repeat protein
LGELLVGLLKDAQAAKELQKATELARSFGDKLLESETARLLAEVCLQLDDLRGARAEATRALELAEKIGSPPNSALAHRVLGMVLARAAISESDQKEADHHFTHAIRILSEVGNEVELGNTFDEYARALSARGDLDGAKTFAERASEIATRLRPLPRTTQPDLLFLRGDTRPFWKLDDEN